MKATALASANIALVKYWGKRNKYINLPQNSSISMTCKGMTTKTTVEFSDYKKDSLIINGNELSKKEKGVIEHISRIRKIAGIEKSVKIVSESNFPVAAGLASSASGLAALTLAASSAVGLKLNEKDLTILARQGSGSASRSICEGFVEWHRGKKEDGTDSFAETIARKSHWAKFRIVATIITESKKETSSRSGMNQTVETSRFYRTWLDTIETDLEEMRKSIKEKDFSSVGKIAEYNCLKMHATMMTSIPSIIYWIPETLNVMKNVSKWRKEGLECYYTIDAGPQVKVMCLEKDLKDVIERLKKIESVKNTIVCSPGNGVILTKNHLF
jgi:diphosphomevalonate decarboxylase